MTTLQVLSLQEVESLQDVLKNLSLRSEEVQQQIDQLTSEIGSNSFEHSLDKSFQLNHGTAEVILRKNGNLLLKAMVVCPKNSRSFKIDVLVQQNDANVELSVLRLQRESSKHWTGWEHVNTQPLYFVEWYDGELKDEFLALASMLLSYYGQQRESAQKRLQLTNTQKRLSQIKLAIENFFEAS